MCKNNTDTSLIKKIEVGRLNATDIDSLITDENNNGIDDSIEHKVKGFKPWTYQIVKSKKKSNFWKAIRATIAGETTFGIIGREIKNIGKHFIPGGHLIDGVTDKIGDSLKTEERKMFDKVFKRALSTDGGSLMRLREQNGRFSWVAALALAVRLAIVAGFLYVLHLMGVPVEKGIDFLGKVLDFFSATGA